VRCNCKLCIAISLVPPSIFPEIHHIFADHGAV
jgi:hypothetical protein